MSPKQIVVFGGTGIMGLAFCHYALDHGNELTIYARNPSKLPEEVSSKKSAKIIKGELDDAALISKAIAGQDFVVSFLGPTEFFSSQRPELFVEAYEKIFKAMRAHHVKRIYAIGTPYMPDAKDVQGGFKVKIPSAIFRVISHTLWKSFVLIGETFENDAKDLDWTIVRVGRLTDAETKKQTEAFDYVGAKNWSAWSSRTGTAKWIVGQIDKGGKEYIHEKPAVSVPR